MKCKRIHITDEEVMKRAQIAVRLELEKCKALGVPITVYDRERKEIVIKNSDGTVIEVVKRLKSGRYSEWAKQTS